MKDIKLNKQQSKTIAQAVHSDIKGHIDSNFQRFMLFYLDELHKADGRPIEPITIQFTPCIPFVVNFSAEDTADVERKACK